MRRKIIAGAAVALVFAPKSVFAQALDRLEVSERGSRFFVADSLDLEGKVRLATGVVTTYQHGLRVFGTKQEGASTGLVADRSTRFVSLATGPRPSGGNQ